MSPPAPTTSTGRIVALLTGVLFFLLVGVVAIVRMYYSHGWVGASMTAIAFTAGMVIFGVIPELVVAWVRRWRGRRP